MRRTLGYASIAICLPLAAALAAVPSHDRSFVRKAAVGGLTEVQEGQLALQKATSPGVKAFAQKMVDAHTQNNEQLAQVAQQQGVSAPTTLDAMHREQMKSLQGLSGTQFDEAYVADQIKNHEAMETVMKGEISHGGDADLKSFADKTLPVVQNHLAMAKGLENNGQAMNKG